MHRRNYLKFGGLSLATLAGCTGGSGGTPSPRVETKVVKETKIVTPEPTPTPTPTPEPTPTATPEAQRPEIEQSSLLYEWKKFGDVLEKQVIALGRGAPAIIGFRHITEVHDGTFNATEQIRVYGPENNRIDQQRFDDEQLVDGDGPREWEHALYFETDDWELGDHRYEILIRDNVSGKVSDTTAGRFEVNAPLGTEDAVLLSVDAPDTVKVGEEYQFTLEIGNQSSRDGSVVSPLSAKYDTEDEWYTYSNTEVALTIPSEEWLSWKSGVYTFDYTGTVQFRIDEIQETWDVEVSEN